MARRGDQKKPEYVYTNPQDKEVKIKIENRKRLSK